MFFLDYLNKTPQETHDIPDSISSGSKRFRIADQWWQRSLKVLMGFEMFSKHREIICVVVLKHFDFGFGGYNPSYDCSVLMFSASDLLNSSTSSKTKE